MGKGGQFRSSRILGIIFPVVFAAVAANAVGVAEETSALNETIASNSVTRASKGNRYYLAYYREGCTEAEREAILDRNVAARRRLIELAKAKDKAAQRAGLGKVLAIGGRWAEAERELSAAIATGKLEGHELANARWALAECLWHRGAKDEAKSVVADIAAMTKFKDPPQVWHKAVFMNRAWTDPDADIDSLKLPHGIDGKPFPTPQEAKYGKKRVSLARVELKFKTNGTAGTDKTSPASRISPVSPADPIIRLLKRKLTRFGTKFEKGGTPILIELSPNAPVDKPQGYSLDVAKGKVVVKARSRLGLAYGVVSLLQCIDRRDERDGSDQSDRPRICEMAIRDWPKLGRRGVVEAFWKPDFLEYALFNKMSSLIVKMERPECSFLFSELERERIRITMKRFNDFGIETYWSAREISVSPVLPLSAKRTRDLHLQWFRWAAQFGGNVSFEMDDERFEDFPEEDRKAFGLATNIDAKYLTSLYHEVKKEFPKFRLMFGPPYYYGPDAKSKRPEPREPYLRSLGEFLDPEIDVYWSGPRVKSAGFSRKNIMWFSDLIGRKPVVYHNSDCVGRHSHISYGVDVPGYKNSHSPETLDLVGAHYQNMNFYSETAKVSPAMDWCWNPDAHDAETATRRMLEMLEGPGVFETLTAAMPAVSYFDKYPKGEPSAELLSEDPDDLDRRVADARSAWAQALSLAKNGGKFVEGFGKYALKFATQLANFRRNPPKRLLQGKNEQERK